MLRTYTFLWDIEYNLGVFWGNPQAVYREFSLEDALCEVQLYRISASQIHTVVQLLILLLTIP